jgi:anti-anti-sigma regulatory factor
MDTVEVSFVHDSDRYVVRIVGVLDAFTATDVAIQLRGEVPVRSSLELDLQQVTFMSSAGWRCLESVIASRNDVTVRPSPPVRRFLELLADLGLLNFAARNLIADARPSSG